MVVQSSDAVILVPVSVTLMLQDFDTVPVELTVPVKVEELASDAAAPARLTSMTKQGHRREPAHPAPACRPAGHLEPESGLRAPLQACLHHATS